MKRKYSGSTTAAMATFLVSGLLVSVLGARQVERYNTQEVWGINGDWPVGTLLRPELLRKVRVDKDRPGVEDPRLLIGKRLATDKQDGEAIWPAELVRPAKSWLAQQIPESKVLYTFTPRKGSIPHTQLRNGDRFDVLVAGRNGVRTVARDARLIGALAPRTPNVAAVTGLSSLTLPAQMRDKPAEGAPLVIAIAPEEVYPLASIAPREKVTIVLHSAGDAGPDRQRIEPQPTHRQVELLSGLKRRNVTVEL
ncbi:hypothetical protein [Pseudomonas sp. TCU-HL1]|uniref:hypothetical protein n=1 Tax=Pseudomonas sp. TCU-HL1 TaxID=1856685 RepID=UPI00083DBB4B|nr:hypothetical protein [Pseudomonas sp. TCU-HL1]AOE83786.1 hypothetical protein THL1_1238 [Pseudomonas sp. TCU-HL1]